MGFGVSTAVAQGVNGAPPAAPSDSRDPARLSELVSEANLKSPFFWALAAVLVVCLVVLAFQYGMLHRLIGIGPAGPGSGSDEAGERLTEAWWSYGHFGIAIFLVFCVTVLLILRVISAEAGLTILSGISGFAVARGNTRDNRPVAPPPNPSPPAEGSESVRAQPRPPPPDQPSAPPR
jgi:hypothetical protein